jgi:hypothetical protein
MAGTALNHPLVRDYLRELDAALAGLPARQAGELREQIATHLDDVLGPDASDQEAAEALRRLGSPRALAAEAGAGPGSGTGTEASAGVAAGAAPPGSAAQAPHGLRALLARPRRRFWALAVAAVLAATTVTWYSVAVQTAGVLETGGDGGWWYPQDQARDVTTSAAGVSQDTVPVRPGQRQGLFFEIYNPSPWTQTVVGWAMRSVQSPTSATSQLSVSTRGYAHGFPGLPRSDRYGLPGVIPPHSFRLIRVLWMSGDNCIPAGDVDGIEQLSLTVQVGLFRRTEQVPLDGEWALSGPGGQCP